MPNKNNNNNKKENNKPRSLFNIEREKEAGYVQTRSMKQKGTIWVSGGGIAGKARVTFR